MDPENPLVNAIEDSLPSDGSVDSSTTDSGNPDAPVETPTPKVEQETPFHEHPRWKERQAELERERQEKAYWQQQAQKALEIANRSTTHHVPEEDPLAGVSPEERQAWERIQKLARIEAEKIVKSKEEIFNREIQQTREHVVALAYQDFQRKHPDVTPNSPEEIEIAKRVKQGYPLEDAYKIVMFDRNAQRAANQVKQQVNDKTKQKMAANLETSTIPQNSGIPQQKKQSFRDSTEELLRKAGY